MESNKKYQTLTKLLSIIIGIIIIVFLIILKTTSNNFSIMELIIYGVIIIVFFGCVYFSFEFYRYLQNNNFNRENSKDLKLALDFDDAIKLAESMIHDRNFMDYPIRENAYTISLGDEIKNTIFVYTASGTFDKNKKYNVFINLNYPYKKSLLINVNVYEYNKILQGMPVNPGKEPKRTMITERPTPFGVERVTESLEENNNNSNSTENKKEDLE